MAVTYDETRTAFRIGSKLASGGQGVVSFIEDVQTHCVKIYHQNPDARHTLKLGLLRARANELIKIAAMPTSLAFSDKELSKPIGIFIPFVKGHEIYELYGTRSRLQHFPRANYKFLIHAAYNLSLAFEELHSRQILIADVNEQNIKVLADATVNLIDCDSFQISSGMEVYTSDVGTPIWTPPELQGCNLAGFKRTANHDLFGLAQMIFLLLFVGRHPFSGVPRNNRQLLPEEAIREYSFAFAPSNCGSLLTPPPGCPPYGALPKRIQELFYAAFLKGSNQPGARPTAKMWKDALFQMVNQVVVCARNPSHVFSKEASSCPWCIVTNTVGVDLFPAHAGQHIQNPAATSIDQNYINRLNNLRPHPFIVLTPPRFTDLTPEPLPPKPTGMWSGIRKMIAPVSWKKAWLATVLNQNKRSLATSENAVQAGLLEQQKAIATYNREFENLRPLLRTPLSQLSSPTNLRREIEITVVRDRRKLELDQFLEQFQIHRAKIPDIGKGRKAVLLSYGIETAADIPQVEKREISGFGKNLRANLMAWRRECESKFIFDTSRSMPTYILAEIEKRFQEKIRKVKEEVANLETKLNTSRRNCEERIRVAHAHNAQHARQRDQFKVNLHAIESALHDNSS